MTSRAIRIADPQTQSDAVQSDRSAGERAFTVDLDGFEGPLDLLLELARRQKVDLAKISILELANQYLSFVEAARKLRLELAADYLVMASWLAYLKSRLLLPEPPKAEAAEAAGLADALASRLKRLEAIRRAAEALVNRSRLGRDVFARGAPEGLSTRKAVTWEASLYDLLAAYATQSQKHARGRIHMKVRRVWSLADARDALTRMIGTIADWTSMDVWLIAHVADPRQRRSARASSFSASLEMVREGLIELRQDTTFAPIYVRPLGAEAKAAFESSKGGEV